MLVDLPLDLDLECRLRLTGVRDVRLVGVLDDRDVLLVGVLDLVLRLVGVLDPLLRRLSDGDLFRVSPDFLEAGETAFSPLWAAVSSTSVATTLSLPLWAAVPSFLTWGSVTRE